MEGDRFVFAAKQGQFDLPRSAVWWLSGIDTTTGPDWKSFVVTQVLAAIPIVLFFTWVAPDIGKDLSWVPVAVAAVLAFISFGSLLVTGLRDPGIIPRSEPSSLPDLRTAVYMINGHEVITKYCTTCHLYRPPRCSHCAVCDNCIEKFDHHCPWVGTCIGRRNYQPYLIFIFTASLSCIVYVGLSIWRLVRITRRSPFHKALRAEWAAAVVIIHCTAGLVFVGALSGFHSYLVATNQTTYEYFRSRGAQNSFSRSIVNNFFEAVCGATGLYAYHPNGTHPTLVTPTLATPRQALAGSLHHTEPIRVFPPVTNGERHSAYDNALHEEYKDDAMLPGPPVPCHLELRDISVAASAARKPIANRQPQVLLLPSPLPHLHVRYHSGE